MQIVGTHTIKMFDKRNDLVYEDSKSNIITTKGRERILDIWSHNLNPSASRDRGLYGIERVDTSPTETATGTRRCTFFDVGLMLDPRNNSGSRNMATYNSYLTDGGNNTEDEVDAVFTLDNEVSITSNTGHGASANMLEYWHCIDIARVDSEEQFVIDTASSDDIINLTGSNLKYDYNSNREHALKVWNAGKTASFAITSDYTFDRASGVLTVLQSGSIPDTSTITVEYKWHDQSLFDTGYVGMYMKSWPNFYQEDFGKHRSYMADGKLSATGGETWEEGAWPWHGRPHTPYRTYYHESEDFILAPQIMDSFSQNNHEHYYFTYPYILNAPTNLAFVASFAYSGYNIQNINFFKPVFNPQTPRVLALGTGNTTPAVGDTELDAEVVRLDVMATDRPANGIGQWTVYIDYEEYSGIDFKEVGLFHGDTWTESQDPGFTHIIPIQKENCNELFSRTLYEWSKTDEQRVELTYKLELV